MPVNSLRFLFNSVCLLLFSLSNTAWGATAMREIPAPTPVRQQELLNLVRQDCGSCHGLLMEGGLGTPLTPIALKDKTFESLRDAIIYGRGSMMPPWRPFFTEAEVDWVVQMLLKGLP